MRDTVRHSETPNRGGCVSAWSHAAENFAAGEAVRTRALRTRLSPRVPRARPHWPLQLQLQLQLVRADSPSMHDGLTPPCSRASSLSSSRARAQTQRASSPRAVPRPSPFSPFLRPLVLAPSPISRRLPVLLRVTPPCSRSESRLLVLAPPRSHRHGLGLKRSAQVVHAPSLLILASPRACSCSCLSFLPVLAPPRARTFINFTSPPRSPRHGLGLKRRANVALPPPPLVSAQSAKCTWPRLTTHRHGLGLKHRAHPPSIPQRPPTRPRPLPRHRFR